MPKRRPKSIKDFLIYSVQKSVHFQTVCMVFDREKDLPKENTTFHQLNWNRVYRKKLRIPREVKNCNSKIETKKKKIPTAVRKTEKSLKRNKRKCLKEFVVFNFTPSLSLTRVSIQPFDISSSLKEFLFFNHACLFSPRNDETRMKKKT